MKTLSQLIVPRTVRSENKKREDDLLGEPRDQDVPVSMVKHRVSSGMRWIRNREGCGRAKTAGGALKFAAKEDPDSSLIEVT